ncbi:unnamed protein product [Amoebophrya sp. A25]|nr:unnamed protein product [Amoebophrya sp. A25]|eukprot:GSA25T00026841001.1
MTQLLLVLGALTPLATWWSRAFTFLTVVTLAAAASTSTTEIIGGGNNEEEPSRSGHSPFLRGSAHLGSNSKRTETLMEDDKERREHGTQASTSSIAGARVRNIVTSVASAFLFVFQGEENDLQDVEYVGQVLGDASYSFTEKKLRLGSRFFSGSATTATTSTTASYEEDTYMTNPWNPENLINCKSWRGPFVISLVLLVFGFFMWLLYRIFCCNCWLCMWDRSASHRETSPLVKKATKAKASPKRGATNGR